MELSSPLIIGFIGSFFLVAVLTLTSFVKVSIVLMIVRNALGLPQVPSNMVVMGLALFIAIFISMPVFTASLAAINEIDTEPENLGDLTVLFQAGLQPFRAFMLENTDGNQMEFFLRTASEVWQGSGLEPTPDMFVIQVPAFMVTELTEAFKMGFVLYLPFMAIDLAVTGTLMALGMQMVQPNIIAVPFKLLIFVVVDGWGKLIEGLVTSYGG